MRLIFGIVLLIGLSLAGASVYMARNYVGAYQTALMQERAKAADAVPTTESTSSPAQCATASG